jgi:hypothetical protein
MALDLAPAFSEFASSVSIRLQRGVHTSEDAIRYTFFWAILNELHLRPEDIILEHSHTGIDRAEVDFYLPVCDGTPGFIAEFKYHRKGAATTASPRPLQAGAIIRDFDRLSRYVTSTQLQRYLVYVTDSEMHNYLSKRRDDVGRFYDGASVDDVRIDEAYVSGASQTLRDYAGAISPCTVRLAFGLDAPPNCFIRIWTVQPG